MTLKTQNRILKVTLLEATNDVGGHAKTWVDNDRGAGPVVCRRKRCRDAVRDAVGAEEFRVGSWWYEHGMS